MEAVSESDSKLLLSLQKHYTHSKLKHYNVFLCSVVPLYFHSVGYSKQLKG
jgi:hypothetical protein